MDDDVNVYENFGLQSYDSSPMHLTQMTKRVMPLKPLWEWGITLFANTSVNAFAQEITL
jgi:hypothetical protein